MGSKGGGQTPEQARTERRKEEEFQKLKGIEAQKTRAAGRRTRGRASLISGSEAGIVEGSDFLALNLVTENKLKADARKESLIEGKRKADLLAKEGRRRSRDPFNRTSLL